MAGLVRRRFKLVGTPLREPRTIETATRRASNADRGRLHREVVVRLANAIREARSAGLSSAGVFSAYRPPAFGIGAFSDKFNSLHSYGLAVDVHGIGRPESPEAQLGTR